MRLVQGDRSPGRQGRSTTVVTSRSRRKPAPRQSTSVSSAQATALCSAAPAPASGALTLGLPSRSPPIHWPMRRRSHRPVCRAQFAFQAVQMREFAERGFVIAQRVFDLVGHGQFAVKRSRRVRHSWDTRARSCASLAASARRQCVAGSSGALACRRARPAAGDGAPASRMLLRCTSVGWAVSTGHGDAAGQSRRASRC